MNTALTPLDSDSKRFQINACHATLYYLSFVSSHCTDRTVCLDHKLDYVKWEMNISFLLLVPLHVFLLTFLSHRIVTLNSMFFFHTQVYCSNSFFFLFLLLLNSVGYIFIYGGHFSLVMWPPVKHYFIRVKALHWSDDDSHRFIWTLWWPSTERMCNLSMPTACFS